MIVELVARVPGGVCTRVEDDVVACALLEHATGADHAACERAGDRDRHDAMRARVLGARGAVCDQSSTTAFWPDVGVKLTRGG